MSFLSKTSFNQKDPQPISKNLQIKQALTKCEGRLEVGFGHLSFGGRFESVEKVILFLHFPACSLRDQKPTNLVYCEG